MITSQTGHIAQVIEGEWITFQGGELEGKRPKVRCAACRARGTRTPLCFQCYRADLDRQRALKAAGQLDTASEPRFQGALPFEPVNVARLARLQTERSASRAMLRVGVGQYEDRRRRAQMAARHALQRIAAGLRDRGAAKPEQERAIDAAIHAAELQLPESWVPFVVSR